MATNIHIEKRRDAVKIKWHNARTFVSQTKGGEYLVIFKRLIKDDESEENLKTSQTEVVRSKVVNTPLKLTETGAVSLYLALEDLLKRKGVIA